MVVPGNAGVSIRASNARLWSRRRRTAGQVCAGFELPPSLPSCAQVTPQAPPAVASAVQAARPELCVAHRLESIPPHPTPPPPPTPDPRQDDPPTTAIYTKSLHAARPIVFPTAPIQGALYFETCLDSNGV